ncbi:hypothetical protein [Caballeronia mineralivorans]|uniref:hypothetical protein n=1 Tax=Caballeronia mineralivorans TaxID=2010198 RepID=UPI0023F11134|nr:hypothetical protein [Caballeronia mineralivorans]MDB5784796.1 hypothetical protein [Caballeronia mineralivorans]
MGARSPSDEHAAARHALKPESHRDDVLIAPAHRRNPHGFRVDGMAFIDPCNAERNRRLEFDVERPGLRGHQLLVAAARVHEVAFRGSLWEYHGLERTAAGHGTPLGEKHTSRKKYGRLLGGGQCHYFWNTRSYAKTLTLSPWNTRSYAKAPTLSPWNMPFVCQNSNAFLTVKQPVTRAAAMEEPSGRITRDDEFQSQQTGDILLLIADVLFNRQNVACNCMRYSLHVME